MYDALGGTVEDTVQFASLIDPDEATVFTTECHSRCLLNYCRLNPKHRVVIVLVLELAHSIFLPTCIWFNSSHDRV